MKSYIAIKITDIFFDKEGNIAWYTDYIGNRYSINDIKHIIKYRELPSKLESMKRFSGSKNRVIAISNMRIDRSDKIYSIDSLNTHIINDREICVLCEDSGSGLQLYRSVLEHYFPDVKFSVISSYGKDNIGNKIIELFVKYEHIIVIVDNKQDETLYMDRLLDALNIAKEYTDIHIFKPTCMEEIVLSSKDLQCKDTSIIRDSILEYLETGEIYYKFSKGVYWCAGKTYTNLENTLYKEAVRVSSLAISKGLLSRCFTQDCCNIGIMYNGKIEQFNNWCKYCSSNKKIWSLANRSLIGGLINTVNKILGFDEDKLQNWNTDSKQQLYE